MTKEVANTFEYSDDVRVTYLNAGIHDYAFEDILGFFPAGIQFIGTFRIAVKLKSVKCSAFSVEITIVIADSLSFLFPLFHYYINRERNPIDPQVQTRTEGPSSLQVSTLFMLIINAKCVVLFFHFYAGFLCRSLYSQLLSFSHHPQCWNLPLRGYVHCVYDVQKRVQAFRCHHVCETAAFHRRPV